jgi:hypothetical protein
MTVCWYGHGPMEHRAVPAWNLAEDADMARAQPHERALAAMHDRSVLRASDSNAPLHILAT